MVSTWVLFHDVTAVPGPVTLGSTHKPMLSWTLLLLLKNVNKYRDQKLPNKLLNDVVIVSWGFDCTRAGYPGRDVDSFLNPGGLAVV